MSGPAGVDAVSPQMLTEHFLWRHLSVLGAGHSHTMVGTQLLEPTCRRGTEKEELGRAEWKEGQEG